jgi:TRAP-type C4-dicarboxylate transport system permease small subunit
MKMMHRMVGCVERIILSVLTILFVVIIVGVTIQVVLRYTLGWSFLWGEELAVYAFVWCIFLGGVVNVWRRSNFAFDSISTMLKGRWARAHRILVDLVIFGCSAIIMWQGWLYAALSVKRMSPALGFSLFVPTLAIPVSAALMAIVAAVHLVDDTRALRAPSAERAP